MRLRSELVLVDQAAEQVAAADAIEVDHVGHWLVDGRHLAEREPLTERAMRSVLVVMRGIGRDHVLEVAVAKDQELVEAFPADAADPALGVRSRLRRPYRRLK